MRTITRTLFVSILFLVCVGCDQVTKSVVRAHVVLGESQSFLGDTVRMTHAENTGAFLSLGDALPDQIKSSVFIVGVGLVSLTVFFAALFVRRLSRWQVAALTLIASGGIGNWIDRLTHDGRVTDFLNVGIGSLRTGIFNVADMVLMLGVVLFFVGSGRQAAANNHPHHPTANPKT